MFLRLAFGLPASRIIALRNIAVLKLWAGRGLRLAFFGGQHVRAIDVSRYQGVINWDAVKSGLADGLPVQAAFIKCGQLDYLDPAFRRNWSEAKRVGVKRGA